MTRRWRAALAAGWMLVGCGGSSLPATGGPGTGTPPDGNVGLPPTGTDEPDTQGGSLWPLTAGSVWVYDILDPVHGAFQKQVTMEGEKEVPGMAGSRGMLVHSRQDRVATGVLYEEYSYQAELPNGLVVRLREEDHRDGVLVRTTTWNPATVKSLARAPSALPWSYQSAVQEFTVLGDGSQEDSDPTYTWRVVEMDVTVQTKAGTFTNAIKVRRDKLNDAGEVKDGKERTYWLVPGVGKVREEGERTEELVRYDIKK
ncbi:hypothetical protein LZ198_02570 [Myxococcus sp. K15C18031901]|uniref:hypothetical protein n=1 Tax=Myxococcus dinghuensis TaxID=2906761 RepID=UPI0020A80C3E|nr:hypothetical protein [Myxococcus dinghuensis]MCP3097756.1 hypothetical protein [Myxococcus dinghuensis]